MNNYSGKTIHIVGAQETNYPWGFENKLIPAFRKLGLKVLSTDFRKQKENLAILLQQPADIVLMNKGEGIHPDIISSIPCVSALWYAEQLGTFQNYDNSSLQRQRELAFNLSAFDYVFSHDASNLDLYLSLGAKKVFWLPTALVDPEINYKLNIKKKYDVVFTGSLTPRREKIFNLLQDEGINIFIKNIWDSKELNKFFNESRIVLNIHLSEIPNTETRISEVLGAGSFLLSEDISSPELLTEDKHYSSFKLGNIRELAEKIRFYLANDNLRESIAEEGHQYAINNLSTNLKCEEFLNKIDFNYNQRIWPNYNLGVLRGIDNRPTLRMDEFYKNIKDNFAEIEKKNPNPAYKNQDNEKDVKYQRILFINHNVYPLELSGTPISTFNHATQMKCFGAEVAVLIPSTETTSGFTKQVTEYFTLYRLPAFNKYKVFLNEIDNVTLKDYLHSAEMVTKDFKPDIVHINDYVFMPPEIISLFHKKGITVIRNVCNLEELCILDSPVISNGTKGELCTGPENSEKCAECLLVNKLGLKKENIKKEEFNIISAKIQERFNKIQSLYRNHVDGVIFTGESFREYFIRYIRISSQITTVIPRGFKFDLDRITKPRIVSKDKIRFGFIGHLNFTKGIDVLLKAFEDISDRNNFIVDIYGTYVEKDYADWINKLESIYPSKIKYHGSFGPDNLKKIAESLDIVIATSYFDTYNRVLRELMYFGVPIIATDFFGSSIITENINGMKIKIGDSKALASAMLNIIDNPQKITELSRGVIKTRIPSLDDEIKEISNFYNSHVRKVGKENVKDKEITGGISDTPEISIVIPTLNNLECSKNCIESIRENTTPGIYEIIVVDNCSSDGSIEFFKSLEQQNKIRLILNRKPETYSHSNNQGAEIAQGKYLLFLNNDTKMFPGWLNALISEFETNKKTGIQGGKLLYPNNTIQHAGIIYGEVNSGKDLHYHIYLNEPWNAPHVNKKREFQMVTGALLAIRTDLFRAIKGFDEKYVFGHEDLDLCMAVRKSGYKVIYNPAVQAYHFESMTKKINGLEKYALNLNDPSSIDFKNYKYFHSKWDKSLRKDADDYYIEDGFKTIPNLKHAGSPKKVKSILFTMYGWNESGGGTIFPKEVTKELVKRGYNVSVFYASLRNDPTLPSYSIEKSIDDGVRLFGIFNRPAIFTDPDHPEREIKDSKLVKIFNEILAEINPDIVHFNNFHGLTLALAEEVKKKGIHSCYTPHNYHMIDPNLYLFKNDLSLWKGVDLIKNSESVKKNKVKKNLYLKRANTARKLLNNWVDVTLAVSSRQKELLTEFGALNNKITVVHQSNKSTDMLWQNAKLAEENNRILYTPLRIGFIGGVMPQKGVHVLASAAQYFNKTEVEFHIYGFVFPEYLEQLKKIDIRRNLVFHGEYKQEQLTQIASQIDLAMVPSVWEDCAPLVVLELHAMRLPVIAARIGGIPDFIEEGVNGFLYTYNSIDELREKIRFCVDNIESTSLMRKSMTLRHSFSDYVDHIETIYEKIFNPPWDIGELELNIGSKQVYDDKRLNITWEGTQFVNHSLANINRELSLLLIEKGYNLSIIPYEQDRFQPAQNSPLYKIKEHYYKQLKNIDIHVRHQWPPNLEAPEKGHWVIIQPWEFGSLPKAWVEIFSSSVDEMWVPSNYVRQIYIDSGVPQNRVFVIPNGFNPSKINSRIKPYKLRTKKKFKFLFVGGTIYRKGIDLLLESYLQTFKKSDNVCLVIKDMGGDSFYKGQTYRDKISEIKKQNNSPEIEYIDSILNEKDLAGIYTACNVLVHPYRGEGFGLPILEAMASGIPAIVTNGGACLDFCNAENSLLVKAEKFLLKEKMIASMNTINYPWLLEPSLMDLKQKMLFAFQNPDKIKEMGGKAMEYVSENFTWERSFEKMIQRMEIIRELPVIRSNKENNAMPKTENISFDDLFKDACNLFKSGDYRKALETIIRAGNYFNPSETNITHEDIYILTGNICLSLNELDGAKAAFETALNKNPQSSEACLGLGTIFYNSGMINEAKTMLDWALKNNSLNERARQLLGEVTVTLTNTTLPPKRDEPEAVNSEFVATFQSAYEYVAEERYRDALIKLYEAEEIFIYTNESNSVTLEDINILKGTIYLNLCENKKAQQSFEKALNINPASSAACLGLGKIFYQADMYKESKTMFEWAVRNDNSNIFAKENLKEINIFLNYPENHNSIISLDEQEADLKILAGND